MSPVPGSIKLFTAKQRQSPGLFPLASSVFKGGITASGPYQKGSTVRAKKAEAFLVCYRQGIFFREHQIGKAISPGGVFGIAK